MGRIRKPLPVSQRPTRLIQPPATNPADPSEAQPKKSAAKKPAPPKGTSADLREQNSRTKKSRPGEIRPATNENRPHLESIGEDGAIDTVLRRRAQSSGSDAPHVIAALQLDLQSIREKTDWITRTMPNLESKARLFQQILIPDPLTDPPTGRDAVLLCTIARIEGLEEPFQELFERACQSFQARAFEYGEALGELLPAEFTPIAKRIAYRDCRNDTAAEDLDAFQERLDGLRRAIAAQGLIGVPTGVERLDTALCGIRGLTFLGAPKGRGKTTLMLSTLRATLRKFPDLAVLLLSFDEPKDRLYQRLFCMEAGITYRQLLAPDTQDRERLEQCKQNLAQGLSRLKIVPRYVRYPHRERESDEVLRHQGFDYTALRDELVSLQDATGATDVLVCVDLFQKWPAAEDVASGADEDHFRLDVLDRLRNRSRSLTCPDGYPMLVLSEIRKDTARELDLNDLKGDGRITSDADCVLLLFPATDRPDANSNFVPMTMRIAKGRDGVNREDVPLWFDFNHYCFHGEDPSRSPRPGSVRGDLEGISSGNQSGSRHSAPTSGANALDPLGS